MSGYASSLLDPMVGVRDWLSAQRARSRRGCQRAPSVRVVLACALMLASALSAQGVAAQSIANFRERNLAAPTADDTSVAARERHAVDLLIANDFEAAHRAYQALAASAPQRMEFTVMVKVLARRLAQK